MRAALWQTTTGIDPLLGARALVEAIERAAGEGADMLFTPEMTNLLDRDAGRAGRAIVAEAADVTLAAAREAAARHGLWLHLGSLALAGEDGRRVNRGFVIDGAGAIRARYDKLHLFDVELPGGERYRESASYAPGARAVVAATPWGGLGLAICYDLRFPALFAALVAAGATMLAVPAAFTVPTGRAHWEVLVRARALDAGAYLLAAAQTGRHADGRATWGHALAVDPWGEVLVDLGEAPGLALVELAPERVAEVRCRLPLAAHARAIGPAAVTA